MKWKREKLRIRRQVDVSEISWEGTVQILSKCFDCSQKSAEKRVTTFKRRVLHPFNPYWLRRPALSYSDEQIASCLGIQFSADTITIATEMPLKVGPLRFEYSQSLVFSPKKRKSQDDKPGEFQARYGLSVMGRALIINTYLASILIHICFVMIAILSYLALVSALMYSTAVFIVFLSAPRDTAFAALSNGTMALALVCFMSVVVAIFGRAARNIIRSLKKVG